MTKVNLIIVIEKRGQECGCIKEFVHITYQVMNNALSLYKPRYSLSVINYQYSNEHQVKTNDLILASLGIRTKLGGNHQRYSKAGELASTEHQEKAGCKASREVYITHPS